MAQFRYRPPPPRPSVADPHLIRPEWATGVARDARLMWLDKNENADPDLALLTKRVVGEIVSELEPQALWSYPECGPLYRKLAEKLETSADHLMLAAGSDGVIRTIFEAFISPGDVVLHTLPTFAMYPVYSRMYGAETHTLEYLPSNAGPFLSVDAVCERISRIRPKLVCLPNPDSPTGTVFNESALRQILEIAGACGSLVLIDEAYHPFHDGCALAWTEEFGHLAIARTFAKAWGLAGLRIGFAIAAPPVVRILHKVKPMYEVNTLAVAVVERMLAYEGDVLTSVKRLNAGRDYMISSMEEMGFNTIRAKGNFMHVSFGRLAAVIHDELKGVALYRLDQQDLCLKGFTRFSATTVDRFRPIIERIQRVVKTSGMQPTQITGSIYVHAS